jgi:hypothetical protein
LFALGVRELALDNLGREAHLVQACGRHCPESVRDHLVAGEAETSQCSVESVVADRPLL